MAETVWGDAANTPSPLSSYPTHTPPPQLPTRSPARYTFQNDCGELLRSFCSDDNKARSLTAAELVASSSTREKCDAILHEVERLSWRLQVAVEERDSVKVNLQGELERARTLLRRRDAELLEKEKELLRLRGVVDGLQAQIEEIQSSGQMERQGGGKSGTNCDIGSELNKSNGLNICINPETDDSVTCFNAPLKEQLWKWLNFMVEQCISVDSEGNRRLTVLLDMLNELQRYSSAPNVNSAKFCSLSRSVFDILSDIVSEGLRMRQPQCLPLSTTPKSEPAVELSGVHEQKNSLLKRITELEAERDMLKEQRRVMSEENAWLFGLLNLQKDNLPQLRSGCSITHGTTLTGEDVHYNAFIKGLEQQLRCLEDERDALYLKSTQQAKLIERQERVLDVLTRHGRSTCSSDPGCHYGFNGR